MEQHDYIIKAKMSKHHFALKRNWSKMRIMGSAAYNVDVFTTKELLILNQINKLRLQLLDDWDSQSIVLGLKPLKKKEKDYGED